ncbi:PREDICTED: putative F-box protein At4g09190 [Ipomoea nil]|uniref:putative F-box protein At4g09190 n=1 Tax=Ipomoea nil TaxID=35883 RepID=UPI000901D032|nr:PREDICTED: putative F-box protein At4g09190 [Ipomoea nil]
MVTLYIHSLAAGNIGAMSSSSKMRLSASTLHFLPQEILVEILSKLPAKSLVRFKCVSKFYCSLIVDHTFADLHRNWSLTLPSRMSILIFYPPLSDLNTCRYYTINYSEENQGKLQANHLRYIDNDDDLSGKVYLRSAVNGLLCFCGYPRSGDDIEIHNLSTRRHISLPTTFPRLSGINACGLLGFDSISRRYKVLKSVQFIDRIGKHVSVKHWIFTLGLDKSWREIHSSPSFHPHNCSTTHFYYRSSVHIDGVIYSLNSLGSFDIVAFDVRTENFKAIPSPPPPNVVSPGLSEVDGRLAILDSRMEAERCGISIWTLEESMVWKKQCFICFPTPLLEEIARKDFNRENLFFSSNYDGEIAVLVMWTRSISILFYNLRRRSWRKFDICNIFRPIILLNAEIAMHFILYNIF